MPRSVTSLLWTSRSDTSCPPTRSCSIATYVLRPVYRINCTPAAAFTQHHSPASACLVTCSVQPAAARGGSGASVARSVRGGTRRARARAGAAKARQGDDIGETENPLARAGGLTGQHGVPVAPVKPALTPEELEAHRAAARARLAEDMGRDDGTSVAAPSSVAGRGRRNRKRTRGGLARRASVKVEFAPRRAAEGEEDPLAVGASRRRLRSRSRRAAPGAASADGATRRARPTGRSRQRGGGRRAAPPSRRR